ncbi:MAG: hypothetical protein MI892_08935 [Desulfobacterales bacterium]|nr:hypothetical protein [Desulfobacterales bacterium]
MPDIGQGALEHLGPQVAGMAAQGQGRADADFTVRDAGPDFGGGGWPVSRAARRQQHGQAYPPESPESPHASISYGFMYGMSQTIEYRT